ncbi:MAG: FecR family protein [Acidobacteriota bacterium]|nr:FecR family protein [Acidobacteriota bacterium]
MRITGNGKGWTAIVSGLFAALLSAPAWGAIPAHPGMVNYVEGQAGLNGQQITSKSVGTAELEQGQTLETGRGKAEILLTPGVFLRLGDNSAVRMDSAGLTNTALEILHGQALVEATDLHEENHIQIADRGSVTTLEKNGLYRFDADRGEVSVYDGKAQVREDDRTVDLKKGKLTSVSALHPVKFDRNKVDDLYQWSNVRSAYLSEASAASAQTYLAAGGGGWAGGGWYWNPAFSFYSYLPGSGFLYSPFGYSYYSPLGFYGSPYGYYGGYGAGYYGRGYTVHQGDRSGRFGRAAGGFQGSNVQANSGFGRAASGFSGGAAMSGGSRSSVAGGGGFGRASGMGGGGHVASHR